tara:strand:+ start:280 stop:948 length:669 start_codon:yes stop_codon:yes gene_type:complete
MASYSLDAVEAIMRQDAEATAAAAELDAIEAFLLELKRKRTGSQSQLLLVDSPLGGEDAVLAQLGRVRKVVHGPCIVVRASAPPMPLPYGANPIRISGQNVPGLAPHRKVLDDTCREFGQPSAGEWLARLQEGGDVTGAVTEAVSECEGKMLQLLGDWLGVPASLPAVSKVLCALGEARPAWAAEALAMTCVVGAAEVGDEREEVFDTLACVPAVSRAATNL